MVLQPSSYFTYARYGACQWALGDRDLTLKSFLRATELNETYLPAWIGVYRCLSTSNTLSADEQTILRAANKSLHYLSAIPAYKNTSLATHAQKLLSQKD